MNKKISTLMAGVALMGAMSVGAQTQVPVTKPAATVVGLGASLANGDVVYLNYNANWQIDFTGTDPKAQKDSLIFKDFGTSGLVGRSKAHIDSLLFKVDYKENKLVYGSSVGYEYTFTFTSKAGKFAFAKPAAGKKAAAYLKTDGELNQWILPLAYLSTDGTAANGALGYAPYFVASRISETDKTPKTVYVLATNMTTNAVEILEISYHPALTGQLTAATIGVAFNETTGIGQLVSNSAPNKTHNLYRINGWKVPDLNIPVSSTNIKDAIGYEKPSFAFSQKVSEGEDNLLAAYNWEYDGTNKYLKAIGAQQPGTGFPLYLTVDTFYYDEANKQNFKLALDTLPGASGTTVNTDMIRNADTYKFTINATFGKDSISIVPQNFPTLTGNYFKGNNRIAVTPNTDALPIIIKTFGDKTVLTVKHSNDTGIAAPAITASETPTWTLSDDEIAQYTAGDVYSLFDANKMKGDKKTANPNYGKALIIDNMSNRTAQVFVDTEDFDATLPSHQWMVLKKNNVYTFKNRETGVAANADGTALTDVQLYVVDADENLYTYGSKADTIKLVKVDPKTLSPFDGYRVITQEEQMNQVFNLRFVSDLLGEEAYVQQGEDSVMNVAIGNADNAAEIRALDVIPGDTISLGIEDHELKVVSYAVKLGRYFLDYDQVKKVYRFTAKQDGEAYGEAKTSEYGQFVITKLVGGNIALVPASTLDESATSDDWKKLAIDSENGNAVLVALNSDLRHAFELTEPANRIFAEVLNGKDTTLVKANFHSVENLGWSLAKGEDDFLYEGVPAELRAGGAEYANEAFDFLLDTAYVNRPGNTMPLYYITFGAARKDSIPVEHIHDGGADHVCPPDMPNDTVVGKYLFIMEDSLNISRENDLKYGYTYNTNLYAKLQMIDAKHIIDTLIVDRPNATAADTLKAGKIADNATVEQMQGQWLNDKNNALFAFRVNMDNDEEYAIYNPATGKYITYLNGFVVASDDAAFYTLEAENGSATANEDIEASVSEVKVIAAKGQITISGAAGKKVVVSNILGQVVANTVLTSDNATIAAPQGVVVVAVEGEEAVKAIVK